MEDVRNRSICFYEEWKRLIGELNTLVTLGGLETRPLYLYNGPFVWEAFFKAVFKNGHTSEKVFSKALLKALQNAVLPFVDVDNVPDLTNGLSFKLKNVNAGFAENLRRERLYRERSKSYGTAKESTCDHCFFVYINRQAKSPPPPTTTPQQSTGNRPKRKRSVTTSPPPFYVFDMTALVELKFGTGRCKPFEFKLGGEYFDDPDLEGKQGPLAQVILYILDVWHCLARRGVMVEKLPLAVLGARSDEEIDIKDDLYLYCLEGHLGVPEHCGETFTYTVTRYIKYPTHNSDKTAAAIYVRTLRIGVERAIEVLRNASSPPVSLIFQRSEVGNTELSLCASPIPYANSFAFLPWTVNQGEMFTCIGQDLSWLSQLPDFISYCPSNSNVSDLVVVKISCAAVHDCYIPRWACALALKAIMVANVTTNVLLAFRYINECDTMIIVMRNLSAESFGTFKHSKILQDPLLWSAFGALVLSTLLPMAKLGVVHADIRPSRRETHNILCAQRGGHGDATTSSDVSPFELRLIDYDSLVLFGSYPKNGNKPAMHKKYLPSSVNATACTYLFWQILWLVFMWMADATVSDEALDPERFVKTLSEYWRDSTQASAHLHHYWMLANLFPPGSHIAVMSAKESHDETVIVALLLELGQAFGIEGSSA